MQLSCQNHVALAFYHPTNKITVKKMSRLSANATPLLPEKSSLQNVGSYNEKE